MSSLWIPLLHSQSLLLYLLFFIYYIISRGLAPPVTSKRKSHPACFSFAASSWFVFPLFFSSFFLWRDRSFTYGLVEMGQTGWFRNSLERMNGVEAQYSPFLLGHFGLWSNKVPRYLASLLTNSQQAAPLKKTNFAACGVIKTKIGFHPVFMDVNALH